jgi:hypothetical protein
MCHSFREFTAHTYVMILFGMLVKNIKILAQNFYLLASDAVPLGK